MGPVSEAVGTWTVSWSAQGTGQPSQASESTSQAPHGKQDSRHLGMKPGACRGPADGGRGVWMQEEASTTLSREAASQTLENFAVE